MTTELQHKKEHLGVTSDDVPQTDLTASIRLTPQSYESMRKTIEIIVDQHMEHHMKTITDMIQSLYQKSSEVEIEVMKTIVEIKKDYLKQFDGKYVAITYQGEVIESAPTELDLLKQITARNIPKEQKIFTYLVHNT